MILEKVKGFYILNKIKLDTMDNLRMGCLMEMDGFQDLRENKYI